MIETKTLAPVLMSLLLVAATALAQTGEEGDTAAVSADKPQATGSDNSASTTEDTDRRPPGTDRAPSDYRASEKISEDLPVSFPVDI